MFFGRYQLSRFALPQVSRHILFLFPVDFQTSVSLLVVGGNILASRRGMAIQRSRFDQYRVAPTNRSDNTIIFKHPIDKLLCGPIPTLFVRELDIGHISMGPVLAASGCGISASENDRIEFIG